MVIDGSAYVYSLSPHTGTLAEYSERIFSEKISQFSLQHCRVDVFFYQYKSDSLKAYARESRGMGKRCKVTLSGKVLGNWKTFMRNDNNKTELFCLLAKSIGTIETGIVYATFNETSICNKLARQQIFCTHEEADTRMFVHLKHAIEKDVLAQLASCLMIQTLSFLQLLFSKNYKSKDSKNFGCLLGSSEAGVGFPSMLCLHHLDLQNVRHFFFSMHLVGATLFLVLGERVKNTSTRLGMFSQKLLTHFSS